MDFDKVVLGEFADAREHLARAVELYSPNTRAFPGSFQDPGVLALTYLAHTLWLLGYPDQAVTKAEEAINSNFTG
jgi:hypothetical protein